MSSSIRSLAVLSVMLIAGCGSGNSTTQVYNSETTRGVVDNKLSQEAQEKQAALRRLLTGFQDGIATPTDLEMTVAGIEFREPIEKFYEGNKRLVRWEFGTPPSDSEFPVILYFDDKEAGPVDPAAEKKTERVYYVSGNQLEAVISRK